MISRSLAPSGSATSGPSLKAFKLDQVRGVTDPVSVMTSPPTVTKGASGAASTIASSVLVQAVTDAGLSTIRGGSAATAHVRYGGTPTYYDNYQVTSTLDVAAPWLFDFMHYGSKFEIQLAATSGAGWLQVWVNDQPIAANVIAFTNNDGSGYKFLVDFTSVGGSAARLITVGIGGVAFGGIYVGPTDTVWKPSKPRLTRAVFLGDSFTVGANASQSAYAYPYVVGRALGWDDVWMSGEAGTGYLANGSAAGGRAKFRDRVVTDVAAYTPDVIVVYGGTNDIGQSASAIGAEATLLYAQLATSCPGVPIYVVGVQYPSGAADATRDTIDTALTAAATAAPNVKAYISAKTWFTGTGKVGTTTGSGNSDLFTSSDGLHPSDAGHLYIGKRIAQGIAAAL